MSQRGHIKSGRTHQVSPGLAETGAMTRAVPLLLMRIPLHGATQQSEIILPFAVVCRIPQKNILCLTFGNAQNGQFRPSA